MIKGLHGFLGQPSDWDAFPKIQGLKIDLYPTMNEWARHFSLKPHSILLGYSLGGRLALHTLDQNWKALIFVSTHPGLQSHHQERLLSDENWAQRFENEPWKDVVNDWNKNPIFKNPLNTPENIHNATWMLRKYSLGLQEDFRSKLSQSHTPILWITGSEDHKFCKIAQELQFQNTLSQKVIIPNAAHRVPWDNPEAFQNAIDEFLRRLNHDNIRTVDPCQSLPRH